MQRLFSTDQTLEPNRFRAWTDYCDQSVVRLERKKVGDGRFYANLQGARFGRLFITRSSYGASQIEATQQTLRHQNNKSHSIFFNMKLSGKSIISIENQEIVQEPGDFAIFDTTSRYKSVQPEGIDQIAIEIPRQHLEGMLGPTRNYLALTMQSSLPTAMLLRSYLLDLMRMRDRLTSDAAERLSTVGIELMVACVAERMALEAPCQLRGTVAVQRAKAYIEANLGNPELSPTDIAAATNVSLRYLQERFRERGRHVSEWVWQRRLETAAHRLSDPMLMHLSLNALAYDCGFTSHAHFSRRFKDRYDISPSDYRRIAMLQLARNETRHKTK